MLLTLHFKKAVAFGSNIFIQMTVLFLKPNIFYDYAFCVVITASETFFGMYSMLQICSLKEWPWMLATIMTILKTVNEVNMGNMVGLLNRVWLGANWASLVAQRLKHLPAMQETWVRSLGREDPLEKEIATHSSILAWRIPWMEEPGGLQSMGLQRVGHDWETSLTN